MAIRLPTLSPFAWITVEKVTQQVLWLILFAILAPILGPRPYGLFSIVMVFVGFCEYVLADGTVEALVSVGELDQLHASTANRATGAITLALSLLIALLAPAIGAVFGDEEITHLLWAMAPLPLLSALSAAPIAMLQRSLQFRRLAIRSIAGLLIGGIFGIVLAIAGAGVWALALQVLAQRLAEVTIAWMSVPARFGFTWSRSHFHEMRPLGINMFTARIMNFGSGQLPRIIIGYALGATELGLFTLANRFSDIILFTTVMPITAVGRLEMRRMVPRSADFERIFTAMTQNVSVLSLPILLGVATMTPALYHLWLDHRWADGVIPAQLIVSGCVPAVLFYCVDAALLAANQSGVFKRLATIQAVSLIVTMVISVRFGLEATCIALAIRQWVLAPLFLVFLRRSCGIAASAALLPALPSFAGAVAMALLIRLSAWRISSGHETLEFVATILLGALFYLAFMLLFSRAQLFAFIAAIFARRA